MSPMSEAVLYEPASEVVDNDAVTIGDLYAKSNTLTAEAVEARLECGQKLIGVKERLGHGKFIRWIEENQAILGFSNSSTARRLMKAARSNCAPAHDLSEPELVKLSRQMWGHSQGESNHRAQGTGENEWYTPDTYLDAAREVLGGFDLDPASSDAAHEKVQAAAYFTKETDGLAQDWHGRVWLNPPYAQPHIADFVSKMVSEVQAGRVEAAIMLTHNYTDTGWFHEAAGAADAICFTRGRIRFYDSNGTLASPTQGQAFFYFGPDVAGFAARFCSIGFITTIWHGEVA